MIGRTNAIDGASTLQITLEACTAFSATAGNAQGELTRTDLRDNSPPPSVEECQTAYQLVRHGHHTARAR